VLDFLRYQLELLIQTKLSPRDGPDYPNQTIPTWPENPQLTEELR
jgi:hypothetical protein